MTIFFFLSGYLITTLLRREFASTAEISIKHFYIRRSLRILPPMYLTLGLACFVVSFLPSMRSATWLGILSALGYFYNYANLIHDDPARLPAGIGVIWSLMIEEHFYLVFPFAYSKLLRSRLTRYQQAALLGSICLGALLWRCCLVLVLHTPVLTLPRWTYSATDARFDSILWGCILAIVWNPAFGDGSPRLNRNAGKLAGGGLLLLVATLMIRNPVLRETATVFAPKHRAAADILLLCGPTASLAESCFAMAGSALDRVAVLFHVPHPRVSLRAHRRPVSS